MLLEVIFFFLSVVDVKKASAKKKILSYTLRSINFLFDVKTELLESPVTSLQFTRKIGENILKELNKVKQNLSKF